MLVHPVVVASVVSLLSPVHAVSKVVGWKLLLNNSSHLLLHLHWHFLGSGGDGKVSVVEKSIVLVTVIIDVIVDIVCGKHLEAVSMGGVTHSCLASGLLSVERVGGATFGKLSIDSTVFTPSVNVVESSEIEVEISSLIDLEFLGYAVGISGVHVPLVSVDLEPMSSISLHVEISHILNTLRARAKAPLG